MRVVWFLFKILEIIFGSFCMVYHIRGFSYSAEPLPHILFFCGTFFGFTIVSILGLLSILLGIDTTIPQEAISNTCGSVMYFLASILSLYCAEKDFHLMYLSDHEEPLHPYFHFSKAQSICALAAGAAHLMNAIFAFDALLTRKPKEDKYEDENEDVEEDEASKPIKLYVFGKLAHQFLESRFACFRHLAGIPNAREAEPEPEPEPRPSTPRATFMSYGTPRNTRTTNSSLQ